MKKIHAPNSKKKHNVKRSLVSKEKEHSAEEASIRLVAGEAVRKVIELNLLEKIRDDIT